MRFLKPLRVVISFAIGILFLSVFLDVYHFIPESIISILTSLQFFPSILKTLAVSSLTVGFIVVIFLTLLFGRVYCSTLCPLGVLQDFFTHSAIWKNKRNKRRFSFKKPWYKFHYIALAIIVITYFIGTTILLNILEPYSVFGRIVVNLGKPIVLFVNNYLSSVESVNSILRLSHFPYVHFNIGPFIFSIAFIVFIAVLSYYKGRLFCNFLCPVGAILGLIARFSFFRLSVINDRCKDCGACEKVCKARCIDAENKKVYFSACIGCFNCIEICPTNGISYTRRGSMKKQDRVINIEHSRRNFLKSMIVTPVIAKAATLFETEEKKGSRYYEAQTIPITPPGSRSIRHFTRHCTACNLCVERCPTQVLVPSTFQYGASGIFQPHLDYSVSYCNYDCVECSQVCPTGAIRPLTIDSKHEVQIGVAEFYEDDCIVKVKHKDCGACSEHCPTKAVQMVPFGDLFIPEMHAEYCIGCGACEHACPAEPRKAIYVIGHKEHQKAKKPERMNLQEEKPIEEFPF